MDGIECSIISKSELERTLRIDSEFYQKRYLIADQKMRSLDYESLVRYVDVSDGNHAGISDKFTDEGVPYYRGQDSGTFFIENSNPICIDKDSFNMPIMRRSHLKKNDVLLSIVGTIGAVSLVYSNKDATCSCKLAILRPKNTDNAELLAAFLNSKYGQMQISRFTRGAVQKGLILEDMDQLIMPRFSEDFRDTIRSIVKKAFEHNASANALITNAQTALSDHLKTRNKEFQCTSIALKQLSESLVKSGRLDAEYYQPKYDMYNKLICTYPKGFTLIKSEFDPVIDKCELDEQEYRYVEIGDVDIKSGTASFNDIETDMLPANARIMTHKGDIIVSTVRPNRGAVAILENDGLLVSGAFTVLRQKGQYKKEVLQILLRTDLYRDWLLRYNVGTSYPVIKDEDVLNMPIPLFDQAIQDSVETKVQECVSLRRKSKELLEYAKQAVEMAIELGEDTALTWLSDKVG